MYLYNMLLTFGIAELVFGIVDLMFSIVDLYSILFVYQALVDSHIQGVGVGTCAIRFDLE